MKLRQEYFAFPTLTFALVLNAGAICALLNSLGCGAAGRRVDKARVDLAQAQAALPAAQAKLQILTDADARIVSANIAVNALAQEVK